MLVISIFFVIFNTRDYNKYSYIQNKLEMMRDFHEEAKNIQFLFYYESNIKYLDRLKEIKQLSKLKINHNNEQPLFISPISSTCEQQLILLENLYFDYLSTMQQMFEYNIELGLNHNLGKYGKLRNAIHDVEDHFNKNNDAPLLVDMLQLRRHEKDFMLRGLPKYVKKFDTQYLELENKIKLKNKQQILHSLQNYYTSFHEFVELFLKVGLKNTGGLNVEIKNLRNEFEINYNSFNIKLKEKIQSTQDMNSILILVIIASLILLIFMIVLFRKEVFHAQERNPLSGLNGNNRIVDQLKIISTYNRDRLIIYFDFDYFKPFNDKFGFKVGDTAILEFVEILKDVFGQKGHFLGHIGGDDFVVIITDANFDKTVNKINKLNTRFEQFTKTFYSTKEVAQGFMKVEDRFGVVRELPLLSCSAAIIQVPPYKVLREIDIISENLAKIKDLAKGNKITGVSIL